MTRHVLMIDSRHRDIAAYPSPSYYSVSIEDTLRNVDSIELVFSVIYKFGTENIVSLFIDEIPSRMYSNASVLTDSFTQLPLTDHLNTYNGGFTSFQSYKKFRFPMPKLSKLTFRFKDTFGNPYPMLDHLLRFEIRTTNRQTAAIDAQART